MDAKIVLQKRFSPILPKHPSFWISIDQFTHHEMFGTILVHSSRLTWTLKMLVAKSLEEEFLFNYRILGVHVSCHGVTSEMFSFLRYPFLLLPFRDSSDDVW